MLEITAGVVLAWLVIRLIELVLRWIADVFPNTYVRMFHLVLTCALVGSVAAAAYGMWKMYHTIG